MANGFLIWALAMWNQAALEEMMALPAIDVCIVLPGFVS